uniref:Nuclear receptor domain-containing protein n=1 Tax=Panagrolaimus sp. JU765 TaxID=591449 RepID=A0AC34R0V8_9BILA
MQTPIFNSGIPTEFLLNQQPGSSTSTILINGKQSTGNSQLCAICGADADGLHYNALSCRSCNAFFRRAVTFKQTYVCRKDGNCDVNQYVRCACRACRFQKCLRAGMKPSAVQPRRDPTGSQKNRKPPKRKRLDTDDGILCFVWIWGGKMV